MPLHVDIPHEPFTLVRAGTVGDTLLKPQAAYFTEHGGRRGAVLPIEGRQPLRRPPVRRAILLEFNADCPFRIVMSPEELAKAELGELGRRWA